MLLLAVTAGGLNLGSTIVSSQGQIAVETVNVAGLGIVDSVNAGPGISVTGPASDPIVNNTGVLSVTAGAGIALSGTAQNPTVNNTGVLSVTGTAPGVTITGTASAPIVNAHVVGGEPQTGNNADVPIDTTATTICSVPITATAGQLLAFSGIATFQNISEALGTGSDVTLTIERDGVALGRATQSDTVAAGSAFCCTSAHAFEVTSAGTHTYSLVGTATGGTGNCKVPANLGSLFVVQLNP